MSAGVIVTAFASLGFRLSELGLEPVADPSFDHWAQIGHELKLMEDALPWAIADWANWGEARWGEKYSQALGETSLSLKTLQTYAWVGRRVPRENRGRLPFSHYLSLAKLPPVTQRQWIDWCLDEEERTGDLPSKRDLQHAVRCAGRLPIATGKASLSETYRIVYADPPWAYRNNVDSAPSGAVSRAERHYPTLSLDAVADLPVRAHVQKDAVLFLWCPEPLRFDVRPIIDAWGFKHKTAFVWDKVLHNFGHYLSVRHEHLLVCVRGSCTPDRLTPMIDSVQTFRRTDIHSQKPAEFHKLIERLYDGPYLELFGRRPVDGWTVVGNQLAERMVDSPGDGQVVVGQL